MKAITISDLFWQKLKLLAAADHCKNKIVFICIKLTLNKVTKYSDQDDDYNVNI
jgi:hypothetical protein